MEEQDLALSNLTQDEVSSSSNHVSRAIPYLVRKYNMPFKIKVCRVCEDEFAARGNQFYCHNALCKVRAHQINALKQRTKSKLKS